LGAILLVRPVEHSDTYSLSGKSSYQKLAFGLQIGRQGFNRRANVEPTPLKDCLQTVPLTSVDG
jgi:hypothetical protein